MGKKKKDKILPQIPAGTTVIDTHCHLDMLSSEDGNIAATVSRAVARGVAPIITVGIDLTSSKKAIHFAAQYDSVFATVQQPYAQ